ncbi:MAG: hypothetical protein WCI74_17650, partial [Actinomycetes bacterium]
GYNWGSAGSWGWETFSDVFDLGLAELKSVARTKPLAVAEIGCAPGPSKAAWVSDALIRARAAGARMVVWFEFDKETDWRLGAEAGVSASARSVLTGPGWVTGADYSLVRAALGI